ncbi:unnamed protein product, partial [Prorocentrum cordatum]
RRRARRGPGGRARHPGEHPGHAREAQVQHWRRGGARGRHPRVPRCRAAREGPG